MDDFGIGLIRSWINWHRNLRYIHEIVTDFKQTTYVRTLYTNFGGERLARVRCTLSFLNLFFYVVLGCSTLLIKNPLFWSAPFISKFEFCCPRLFQFYLFSIWHKYNYILWIWSHLYIPDGPWCCLLSFSSIHWGMPNRRNENYVMIHFM